MAKYLSNRQQNLKIGIVSYTENQTVLEVTGKVGIGTTNTQDYELYVNGDIKVTGIATFGTGTITVDGNTNVITVGTGVTISSVGGIDTPSIRVDVLNVGNLNVTGVTTLASAGGITTTGGNLFVGQNLEVAGTSNFIGTAIFRGGSIGIGDSTSDNIDVGGEFVSNLVPSDDGLYDLGIEDKRWRNARFSGLTTTTNLYVSGVTTLGITSATNLTSQQLNVSGISTLGITSTTNLISQQLNVSGITTLGVTSTTNLTSQQLNVSGISTLGVTSTTNLTSQQLNVSGISTLGVTSTTNLTSQQLNVSGISTFNNNIHIPSSSVGIGTTNPLQRLQVGTANTLGINTTGTVFVVTSNADVGIGTTNPIAKLHVIGDGRFTGVITATTFVGNLTGTASTAGVSTSVIGGIASVTQLSVSGISTFNNNVHIPSSSVGIGTTNPLQRLQIGTANTLGINTTGTVFVVTSNADVGIGTTNPTSKLHVIGNVLIVGVSTLGITSTTNLTSQQLNVSGITTLGVVTSGNIYSAGIITASQLSTGASGTGININTDTISGPATLTIDPAAVGDNTGAVRIKGDLYVDGTQFIVNSTTIELADFNVGIATTVGTNILLDGAGIGIGSANIRKTFTYSSSPSDSLKSSENLDIASGKVYKIAGTEVLSSTQLTVANINATGISTLGITSTTNLTSQQLNVSGISTLGVTSTTNLTSQQLNVSGISTLGVTSTTNLTSQQLNVSGITTLGVTSTTNLTSQQLNVSGISTLGITSTTNLTSQQLNVSGISTLGITSTTNLTSQQLNVSGISTLGITSTTNLTSQQLNVSGISTFNNNIHIPSSSVGIGTTNPLQRLQIGTANTLGINTTGTVFVVTSNADVGIGTTNPTSKLHVIGDGRFTGVITATTFSGTLSGFASTAGVSTSVIGGIASVTQLTVSGISTFNNNVYIPSSSVGIGTTNPLQRLQVGTANTLGINTTGTVFVVTSNADVGIGTTNPTSKLHVIGNVLIVGVSTLGITSTTNLTSQQLNVSGISTLGITSTTNLTSQQLNVSGISTFNNNIHIPSSSVGIGTTNPLQRLQVGTANTLGINTTGTVFVVTSNADVGIGTTNPTSKLHVIGDGRFTGVITATTFVGTLSGFASTAGVSTSVIGGIASVTQLNVSGITTISVDSSTNALRITQTGSGNALLVEDNTNPDATPFVINAFGSVGIGTTNPTRLLNIEGVDTRVRYLETDATIDNRIWNVGVDGQEFSWQAINDSAEGGGSRFVITRSGNLIQEFQASYSGSTWLTINNPNQRVGIGTTNPTSKLHVIGDVLIVGVSTLGITSTTNLTSQQLNVSGITTLGITSATNLTSQQLNVSGITTVGFITATNLYVTGVGTFLSSGLKIRNPANTFGYTITGGAIAADRILNLPVITATDTIATLGLSQTFTASQTFSGQITATDTLNLSGRAAGSSHVFGSIQTTSTIILGGTTGTGTITLGRATTSQQTDIQAGVSGLGTTKTINFGTGGDVGSFTNINIGSATTDANSNILIAGVTTFRNNNNAWTDVTINSGSSGYPEIDFQNAGALSVNGGQFLYFDGTDTEFSNNNFSVRSKFSVNSVDDYSNVLVVTNETGGTKNVGIGTTNPTSKLHVIGDGNFTGVVTATTFNGQINAGVSTISVNSSTDALRITQTGSGNALVVEDSTNPDASPFVIKGGGYGWVGIGTTNPISELHLQSVDPIIRFTEDGATSDNGNWNVGVDNETLYFQAINDSGGGGGDTFRFTRSSNQIVSFEGRKSANTWFIINNTTQRIGIGTTNPLQRLQIGTANTLGINTTGTVFVVTSNADVGIGTTNPTSKLHVVGNVLIVGVSTLGVTSTTNLTSQQLNVSGISTLGITSTTNLTSQQLNVSGITTLGITSATNLTAQQLNVSGISTFTNGPVFIGSGTSTGTANQNLQVSGSAYIAGDSNFVGLGIGITNATTYPLDIRLSSGANIPQIRISPSTATRVAGIIYANAGSSNMFAGILNSAGQATNFTGGNLPAYAGMVGMSAGTSPLLLVTNALERVRVFDTGEVGIGTTVLTGTASQRLQVDGGAYVSGNLGIGTTNPTSALTVVGDGRFTGVVTATSFSGTLSGYASSAGIATEATKLQTSRTFEITGDIVGSPISFDGTGNVSIAATIQPNSVGLGTDTTGDYVQSISGTANQISVSVTSGEGSTPTLSIPSQFTAPQDVTVTRDLQVNRNLNVNGNITIGGTTATLFTETLTISDAEIIVGYRTDGSGNDASNDTTANHGGIAVASTEGTPLVRLVAAGIETLPATYKKILWFKAGTFSGLGTDAWLFNYAVGIGSTQVPNGVRLAAGGMQVTDSTISSPQLNISGFSTFSGITTHTASLFGTQASFTGVITATTFVGTLSGFASTAGVSTSVIGGIASVTQLTVSGVSTFNGNVHIPSSSVGIGTTNPLQRLQVGTANTLGINTTGTVFVVTSNADVGIGTTNPTSKLHVIGDGRFTGVITATTFVGTLSGFASTAGIATYATNAGIATNLKGGAIGNIPYQSDSDTTVFLTNGGSGTILQSNGPGATPTWVPAAPSNSITGLTIRDEGTIVGGANSVSTLNFFGAIVSVASTAGIATITFLDYVSNAGIATYATNAGIATNLKGGAIGNISYQSDSDTTVFLANGGSGTILQSNGIGAAPTWITPAPAGAITGLTIRDEGTIVGGANSVSTLNFVGGNISVASTAGIATITIADNLVGTALSISGISTVGFLTATNIWNAGITTSSRLTLNGANSTSDGGGQIYLNGATGNRIDFNQNGVAAPAFTTRSAGTKIVLYPTPTPSTQVDFAFGIQSATLWSSVPEFVSAYQFRWYGGTTQLADLKGTGEFLLGSSTLTGTALQRLQVDGGAYVSGNLGVGNTNGEGIKLFVSQGAPAANRPVALITDDGTIPTMTGGATLRISNDGSGNTFALLEAESNAGKLVFTNAGNLGIGTTNPSSKLTVVGGATITNPGANALAVRSGASGSYANFNIGRTTNEVSISVAGNAGEFANNASAGDVVIRTDSTGKLLFTNGASNSTLAVAGNNVLVGTISSTGTSGQVLQVAGINSSVYIGGNLGIGNTNPQNTLDVGVGTIRLINKSSTGRFSQIYQDNNLIFSNSSTNDDFDWTNSTGSRMRLYGAGNLVIPGTFTPTGTASQRLQVDGGAYVSTRLGVGVTNPASNTQVAIAGTFGISEVGGAGTRTLFTSSTSGFTLNHNDNSQITFQTLGTNRLTYSHSSNFWTIPAGIPFLVGTASSTGTANQLLRVEGGAYVSGNLGIGTTNPGATLNVVPTATSIAGLFSGTTSSDMVRITQLGTGNALVVEDSTNPDSSPFVVTGIGSVGIGTASPAFTADIAGDARVTSTNKMRFGGTAGTTNFYIQYNSTANSLDFVAG